MIQRYKIIIATDSRLIQGYKTIIVTCKRHIKMHGKFFFHTGSHTIMALYILERPSSWSTSRIHLSRPLSRGRLSLSLVPFPQVHSCLLWTTQYLTVCPNGSCFALNPILAYWRPSASVQVNNTSVLHHIHMDKCIYITSVLLLIFFFTLLPLPLAGRLPLTLPVGHS